MTRLGVALALFTLSGSFLAPIAGAATAPDDLLTTAVAYDGSTTREVALRPFNPVAHLHQQLPSLSAPNQRVVTALLQYPRDGRHDYWWPKGKSAAAYDGATTDIVLNGNVVLRGEPQGRTFCCGLTLEALYRALAADPQASSALSTLDALQFKSLWFCRDIFSPGPTDALTDARLGRAITDSAEVLPGDFVQLWRHNRSGHSVVFVAWAVDLQGKVVGFHYWSTQPGTDGIAFTTELFGTSGKSVDLSKTGFARLLPAAQWTKR